MLARDGDHDLLAISYAEDANATNSRFLVNLLFCVGSTPLGTAMAAWTETMRIVNTTTETLDFHLFQYVNFDLGNTADNDS